MALSPQRPRSIGDLLAQINSQPQAPAQTTQQPGSPPVPMRPVSPSASPTPPQHSGPIPPPQQPPVQPPAQPQQARFGWPGGQSGGGGFYPLAMPSAPQALDLPPPPAGLNQLVGPSGGTGQPTVTDPRNMPVFQGFPGPFPGDNPIPAGGTPQERAMARLDSLALPPAVLARLRATLTGQSLTPGTNTGGTGGGTGGTGGTGTDGSNLITTPDGTQMTQAEWDAYQKSFNSVGGSGR